MDEIITQPGYTPMPNIPGTVPDVGPVARPLSYFIDIFCNALNNSITVDDIILILASVVGVGMLFFLAWLGVRKATRTFTTAVSTGKIKI